MRLTDVLDTVTREGDGWRAEVPEDWLQGRSAFGGVQGALALRAMRALVPAEVPLRSLQMTFLAPVEQGTVRIEAKLLREGKNTLQVEARLVDGAQTLCLVVGIFGRLRESLVHWRPRYDVVPVPAEVAPFPYLPGITPAFTQHFRARWLRGDLPFSGGSDPSSVVQLSLREPETMGECQIVAYADFIPPLALSMLKGPTPGSSLTWMLQLLSDRRDLPSDNWRIDAQLDAAIGGYTHQGLTLWGPDGTAVAIGRQAMVVFG